MQNNTQTEQDYLDTYNSNLYDKPSVTSDIVVLTTKRAPSQDKRKRGKLSLQVLLKKRDKFPYKNAWSLIGGIMKTDETLDQTVDRKLLSETGLKDIYKEQLYTFSEIDRDPRMRILSSSYMSLLNKAEIKTELINNQMDIDWYDVSLEVISTVYNTDKTERTQQFSLTLTGNQSDLNLVSTLEVKTTKLVRGTREQINIIQTPLGFDHARIIFYALTRLRNKIYYTDLAFNLLNEEFTLPHLQEVYELILDKPLHKSVFREQMSTQIEETGNALKEGAYRPSKGYRYVGEEF